MRADMRRKVKKLLRRYKYPPDAAPAAVEVVIEQAERVCRDWAYEPPRPTSSDDELGAGVTEPFIRVAFEDVEPFVDAVPLYDLKVAAGAFAPGAAPAEPSELDWVRLPEGVRAGPDLFVAQVVGESMNRRIPNGAWCLWCANPGGSRNGKVVLAEHRDIADPEHGGSYTVKVYESVKVQGEDGGWAHEVVRLKPDSDRDGFEVMEVRGGDVRVVAEWVRTLSSANRDSGHCESCAACAGGDPTSPF